MKSELQQAIADLTAREPRIFLGPRPGKKSVKMLQDLELTHCCTLLSEREQPQPVAKIARQLGCDWVWLPIEGGHVETLRSTDIAAHIRTLAAAIGDQASPRLYLHCSAGIHRTGFFALVLLRLQGLDRAAAAVELASMREVTAEQVGDARLELADQMAEQLLAQT